MTRWTYIAGILIVFQFSCHSEKEKRNANLYNLDYLFSLNLKTTSNEKFNFRDITEKKASVFVFLAPDCPLCEGYSLTINNLRKEFKEDSISFYGVFPGTLYALDEMRIYQHNYGMTFPCIQDPEFKLTHLLNASVTPEVIVLGRDGQILYSGRIDNWAFAPSKKRTLVTEHNLKDVLLSIRNKTPVRINKTEAIGCLIEY